MAATSEFVRIAQAGKDVDPGWYRIHRRVSIHITRAALQAGIQATQVSVLMMIVGAAGAALLVPLEIGLNVLGFGLLYVAFLLDKVDGEIARCRVTQSARGVLIDRFHHRIIEPALFAAVAFHEFRLTGAVEVLVAGFVTMLLANAIEENQHLAPYIFYKRIREGGRVPEGPSRARSPAWALAAAALRPLKGFRMLIVALPFYFVLYVMELITGRPLPAYGLYAAAVGLGIYLVFQCLYYFREQLETETSAIDDVLRNASMRNTPKKEADDELAHTST
jgi:phosphatidylglycerophosphate synthase